jgi:hypothetical protein
MKLSQDSFTESKLDEANAEAGRPPNERALETSCDEKFEVLC